VWRRCTRSADPFTITSFTASLGAPVPTGQENVHVRGLAVLLLAMWEQASPPQRHALGPTLTVWTLWAGSARKRSARCALLEDCGHWDVVVWNGPSIVLWERVDTEEIARARSDEYWSLMVSRGWGPAEGEPIHTGGGPEPFRPPVPRLPRARGRRHSSPKRIHRHDV
jgi:hypothetical protein